MGFEVVCVRLRSPVTPPNPRRKSAVLGVFTGESGIELARIWASARSQVAETDALATYQDNLNTGQYARIGPFWTFGTSVAVEDRGGRAESVPPPESFE